VVKKNILIISRAIAPATQVGAKRFSFISSYLDANKFNTILLSLKEKYFEIDKTITAKGKIYRTVSGPIFRSSSHTLFGRTYNKLCKYFAPIDLRSGWVLPAIIKGISIVPKEKIDIIITTGPSFSSFAIGYFLSSVFNKKLILDYRDPWFPNPTVSTIFFRKNINPFLEKIFLRHATIVVLNNKKAEQIYLNSNFGQIIENKTEVITNGYSKLFNEKKVNKQIDDIKIIYAGNLFKERKLSYLFIPLKKLCSKNNLDKEKIKIIVYGKIPEHDKKLLAEIGWADLVEERSYIPQSEVIKEFLDSDILYLPQIKDGKYSIPIKFYDYISVMKPILAVGEKNTAVDQIIDEMECGEFVEYDNDVEMYNALEKIIIKKKNYRYRNVELYSWKNIAKQFENILIK